MSTAPRGNERHLDESTGTPRLLKIYRRRHSRVRESLAQLSHFAFEGKRGVSPEQRRETELQALTIWNREGFAVPRVLDAPLPPGEVSLWLEYIRGFRLYDVTHDPLVPQSRKEELSRQLGREHGQRHARALELNEPLLLHEHATTKHVLVSGERLVTIDLEGGYAPGYSVINAIGRELAGFLRSLWPYDLDRCFDSPLTTLYIEGYGDRKLLERAGKALRVDGPASWFRRASDRKRRPNRGKWEAIRQLRYHLEASDL